MTLKLAIVVFFSCLYYQGNAQTRIDRKALVQRHTVKVTSFDSLSSLTVGNGKFAFTVDATGLQTFPDYYRGGVPLSTQSEWGWHSFRNTAGYRLDEAIKPYSLNGRTITYTVQWDSPTRNRDASNWFRQNPHRLQLGSIGFELSKENGTPPTVADIEGISQQLDMWTGEITSIFTFENTPVEVKTFCHQDKDLVAVYVKSELIAEGKLKIRIRFPYPTGEWTDVGNNWTNPQGHTSEIESTENDGGVISHTLDTTRYYTLLTWTGSGKIQKTGPHDYSVIPSTEQGAFSFTCQFSPEQQGLEAADFKATSLNSALRWGQFWNTGGAVDFSGSSDARANELERRIVLSQYITKIQCAGNFPPQETGLTYNSWFGKPHLEMHWWHGVHFALWNRTYLLEPSVKWYANVAGNARKIAMRQGLHGVRWQKMTDHQGNESPSSVGAFLIWQQPHFIYFAELLYRQGKDLKILNEYKDLVFATADFMSSYAWFEEEKDRYILGKGLIPAQERFKPEETFNPTYELSYWHWGLSIAQAWRKRLRLPPSKKWDSVINKLSKLPINNNVYLAAESAPDSYTNPEFKTDHPSVLGTFGMLPGTPLLDTSIMKNTFDLVMKTWTWNDTWGWDFPMTAMTATRLGLPDQAVDALLMNIRTNTYLPNGHNFQDNRLRIYLPGNGGLLAAVAMMCAGFDGSKELNPGIPKNGKWKVKWEGLLKMP